MRRPTDSLRRRHARLRAGDDQRGFTLAELIISITVMGIIIVPLAMATTQFLKIGQQAAPVYTSNLNSRLLATYLRADAQAAERIDTGAPCATNATNVVNFAWADSSSRANVASYIIEPISGSSDRRLVRRLCVDGSIAVTSRLVDNLGPTNVPAFTCSPDCAAPDTVTLDVVDSSGYRSAVTTDVRIEAP